MNKIPAKTPGRIYLYGMTVLTTMHRLAGEFPEPDSYAEIAESYVLPGGECGNAATLLAHWGHPVNLEGTLSGRQTKTAIENFFSQRGVTCSGLRCDESFEGAQDLVLVAGSTRTIFGRFGAFYAGPKRWAPPDMRAIEGAAAAGIDPWFGEETLAAVRGCVATGVPYVTIDCPPESETHSRAAASVVSGEYVRGQFPGADPNVLLTVYTKAGGGLVILTSGAGEVVFGRAGGVFGKVQPPRIQALSTLGAGDAFRGAVIHGIAQGWEDETVVRFACAAAASVCRRFPFAIDPPPLDEVNALAATLCQTSDAGSIVT